MAIRIRIERRTREGSESLSRLPDGAWKAREDDHLLLAVETTGELPSANMAGEPLPSLGVSRTASGFLCRFELVLLSFAGRTRIKLEAEGAVLDWVTVDVAPRADKLGETAYREMLAELVRVSKDLPWGFSPADHAATCDSGSPGVVHPAVLEAELPPLLASLRRICADPLIWIERPRVLAPLPRNREIDPGTFRWLLEHPRALRTISGEDEEQGEDPRKTFVLQRERRRTWNHPANRTLKYEVQRLIRALRSSREGLQKSPAPRAKELAGFLDEHLIELQAVLKSHVFREVQAEPPDQTALLTLFDQPLYARAHKLLHRLLDPGLRLSDDASIQASLRHSFDLFELLVLYRLWNRLVGALGREWKWKAPPLPPGGALAGPANGSVFRADGPDGSELELLFQQTFQSWPRRQEHTFWSLSGERRPDYVLLLRRPDRTVRWVLLDAKYRSSRTAVLEGLRDLHVYRDSLRWNEERASAGFILVPALHEDATAFAESGYQERHRFGALIVDSLDWVDRILAVLEPAAAQAAAPLASLAS